MKRLGKGLLVMSAAAILAVPVLAPAADEARLDRIRQLLDTQPLHASPAYAKNLAARERRPGRRVTVVVQMAGDSVASAKARVEDHSLTAEQKAAIRQAAAREQASVEPAIAAHGGRVLNRFSNALNGVKVEVDASQIESLRSAPGVIAVRKVRTYRPHNVRSVPFIGAPLAWQGSPRFRGEGQKIAVIDSGIDYTHANFGGPGTVDAYDAANAADTAPANPAWFGPKAPKVKGGIDLVGDEYDADSDDPAEQTPQPDPNPLDCNGHGSHVAGSAAGFGVAADGTTYSGPYTAAAITPANFLVGPGVAPKADLYSIRVFGCDGSTNVVVDAIEWAIANDVDVINLSLGADYGTADDADAVAVDQAARAGILVVTSAGNSGPVPYITGSPGTADASISTASLDAHPTFAAANITFDSGAVTAINANVAPLPSAPLEVEVLRTVTGDVSLGCEEAEYENADIAGKLVVTLRGVCDRVFRVQAGERHGAAAVLMINNAEAYPPFEGPIEDVTIPFFGVPQSDGAVVTAATVATSITATTVANPGFRRASDFSSGGPRFGDSVLKPNVTAPGTSIFSTGNGTGNQGVYVSGTSMASPHVAGVAALTSQAHPKWNERSKRAAVVQSASPTALLDYAPGLEGAGLVQAVGATRTQAVAFAEGKGGPQSISFGFEEFVRDFRAERDVTVRNLGDTPIVFRVSSTARGGSPHTLRASTSTLAVAARRDAKFKVSLRVPVETVGATHDEELNPLFPEVAGYVSLTPASSSMNGGVTLTLPYYLVPRARSNVEAVLAGKLSKSRPTSRVLLANILGGISGSADFYSWGLHSPKRQGVTTYDTRAVGVQALDDPRFPDDKVLVFAINTFERFSSPQLALFDFLVDVDANGTPDHELVAADQGLLTQGFFDGVFALAIFDLASGDGFIASTADAPTDGSTVLLPLLASSIGVTPEHPRFSYTMATVNLADDSEATLPGEGRFNAFTPAITSAQAFTVIDRNRAAVVPVSLNAAEWARTPALGLMVVSIDNKSGRDQAILLPAR
jgi:minor extracellular serine protease Vpr